MYHRWTLIKNTLPCLQRLYCMCRTFKPLLGQLQSTIRNTSQRMVRVKCERAERVNLEKLSFRCDQQCRKSNFSDVFCLNCIFVIDATVKHLISKCFLNCGVSAETMAAHKHFFIKLNQIFIILVSLLSL